MGDKERKTVTGYVMGQAITYFFLSILFMRATIPLGPDKPLYGADKPFFFIDKSGIVPLPMLNLHINFAYWILIILAFVCLGLSLFFLAALFRKGWMYKAKDVAISLSIPFAIFILASFIVSWVGGLINLITDIKNPVIIGIFFYAGFLVFLALEVKIIWNMVSYSNKKESSSKA